MTPKTIQTIFEKLLGSQQVEIMPCIWAQNFFIKPAMLNLHPLQYWSLINPFQEILLDEIWATRTSAVTAYVENNLVEEDVQA